MYGIIIAFKCLAVWIKAREMLFLTLKCITLFQSCHIIANNCGISAMVQSM